MFSLARQLFQQETLLVFNKAEYLGAQRLVHLKRFVEFQSQENMKHFLIVIEEKVANLKKQHCLTF